MEIIGNTEKELSEDEDDIVTTSYHPGAYRKCFNNKHTDEKEVIDPEDACKFLPCHYFDYIGGTSTGG
jgi:hypothetical protein